MNRLATRSMLLMTRRPSASTRGRVAKRLSSSTSWATARVDDDPAPMAIPMSESLRASTSLTPSPVMATVRPRDWRAWTMARFWWGVTRPNTEARSTSSASASGSAGSSRASVPRPAQAIPTRSATAATVAGWSPEITFSSTPCSRKKAKISAASSRTVSASSTRPTGWRGPASSSPPHSSDRVTASTRAPASAWAATRDRAWRSAASSSTSGAPRW